MMIQENKKHCKECGTVLTGRADKKYCDSNCRSLYHNRANRKETERMRQVERVMRRNRNYLDRKSQNGRKFIPVVELFDSGFDLKYFTHFHEDQEGRVWRMVYDIPYLLTKKGILLMAINRNESETLPQTNQLPIADRPRKESLPMRVNLKNKAISQINESDS